MRRVNVDDILEWKNRAGDQYSLGIVDEINRLEHEWRRQNSNYDYFSQFIVIRLATFFEVHCREGLRELIDFGNPFFDRSKLLLKDTKIDFDALSALHGKKITVGDLVAHSISLSSIDSFVSAIQTILPDFMSVLKLSHQQFFETRESWPLKPIVIDIEHTFKTLTSLLTHRHILVHELPTILNISDTAVLDFLEISRQFHEAFYWLRVYVCEKNIAYTQAGMTNISAKDLKEDRKALARKIKDVRRNEIIDRVLLNDNHTVWRAYAKSQAAIEANAVKGGSMWSMVYMNAFRELIAKRTKEIDDLIARKP